MFLQMNKSAGRLDQSLKILRIVRVRAQPKMLKHIVRFVVMLFIPTTKKRAIIWMTRNVRRVARRFAFELANQLGNPLAFAHEMFKLAAASMMGKPFIFWEGQHGGNGGRTEE